MLTRVFKVSALIILMALPMAQAAETDFDVDVTVENVAPQDYTNLPVFFKLHDVFGRGVPYTGFNPKGFHVYDASGKEVSFSYRIIPPAFAMSNNEIIVTVPKLAKGQRLTFRFTNTKADSRTQQTCDIDALIANPNNMIPNGGFEKGTEGWEGGKLVTDEVKSGKKALLIEVPVKGGKARVCSTKRNVFVKGVPYYGGIWAKCSNVARHAHRWPKIGGTIHISGSPMFYRNGSHHKIMDNRPWYWYEAGNVRTYNRDCIRDVSGENDKKGRPTGQLIVSMSQKWLPYLDPDKPARIWIDGAMYFPQPKITPDYTRITKRLAPSGQFVYRRAATCLGVRKFQLKQPKPYERISAIQDTAVRGERKIVTLGLTLPGPAKGLHLDVSELSTKGGETLNPVERTIEFFYTPTTNWKFHPTSLEGWVIDGNDSRDTDRPGRVDWIVGWKLRKDMKPGLYEGTIAIKSADKTIATVSVKLAVEDYVLKTITDRFVGEIYNNGCNPARHTGATIPRRDKAFYKYYGRTNFTMMTMMSHFLTFKKGGVVDLEKLKNAMTDLRDLGGCTAGVALYWSVALDKHGRSGLWPKCGKNPARYRAQIKAMDDMLKKEGLPRLVYMVWDEARSHVKGLDILKGTESLTTADMFGNELLQVWKRKTLTHVSVDDPSSEVGPMTAAYCKKLGVNFGFTGWPSDHLTRYQNGIMLASLDVKFWHHWHLSSFIAWHKHWKKFVRGPHVVGQHEGMVDLQYHDTLLDTIARAKKDGKASKEVAAAEKYLKDLFHYCSGDFYWVGVYNGSAEDWGDDWFYDRWRTAMRNHTLEILNAMGGPLKASAK